MRRAPPKWAKRVDANQRDVRVALEAAGWRVEIIGRPVDLLIAKAGFTMLLETKPPGKEARKDQREQQEFIRSWPGAIGYGTSPAGAMMLAEDCLSRWRQGLPVGYRGVAKGAVE